MNLEEKKRLQFFSLVSHLFLFLTCLFQGSQLPGPVGASSWLSSGDGRPWISQQLIATFRHTTSYSYTSHFNYSHKHVFGLKNEAGEPRENPCRFHTGRSQAWNWTLDLLVVRWQHLKLHHCVPEQTIQCVKFSSVNKNEKRWRQNLWWWWWMD